MRESPLVSVILPCYNVEEYIEGIFENIRESTYTNYEMIFVDDGSSDHTLDRLHSLKDLRVVVLHKENGGVSSARNYGIKHAKGKYILFVDPDDTLENTLIEKVVIEAERCQAELIVFGYYSISGTKKKAVYPKEQYELKGNRNIINCLIPRVIGVSANSLKSWQSGGSLYEIKEWGAVWRFFYRRDVIINNEIWFDESLKLNEDAIFNCHYFSIINSVSTVNECLYHYYIKETGAMMSQINGSQMVSNKIAIADAREGLRNLIYAMNQIKIEDWYQGSLVLSVFEILSQMSKAEQIGIAYKNCIKYIIRDDVQRAVKCTPLGKKWKFALPLLFCKLHLYFPLFLLFRVLNHVGVKIEV